MKILIVDDDPIALRILRKEIETLGHECIDAVDGEDAWERFRTSEVEVVISDWTMPRADGLELCRRIRAHPKPLYTYFILLTISEGRSNLMRGIEAGADDFITKPFRPDELQARLIVASRITSLYRQTEMDQERIGLLEEQMRARTSFQGIVGKTARMQEIFRRLRLAGQSEVSVLLTGPSGTGKELAARAIHAVSARRERPFLAINCGAIPDTLLESELFGHVKGAFTGADRDKMGMFEAANGGTLFLDEIGDVSPLLQLKLLRALQEREIRRVGEERARPVDVRIISATNRPLEQEVAAGSMRQDFYYRIRVFEIQMPPLTERREDIPLLVEHMVEDISRTEKRNVRGVTHEAMMRLMEYPWPGNVRELRNALEHAFVVVEGDRIDAEHLPLEVRAFDVRAAGAGAPPRALGGLGASPFAPPGGAASGGGGASGGGNGGAGGSGAGAGPTAGSNGGGEGQADTGRIPAGNGGTAAAGHRAALTPEQERQRILTALAAVGGNRSKAARLLGISRVTLWKRIRKLGIDPSAAAGG